MAKNNGLIILIAIVALVVVGMFVQKQYTPFVISGTETMTRTSSAMTVNPSSTFTLTYTSLGTSGSWGASVQDAVSGGCLFPAGTASYKTVMLSYDGLTKQITMTAPASGSCTFTGDYQFGSFAIKPFSALTVNVCAPSCVRPTNLCLATSSNGCGSLCNWNVVTLNSQDINCDNKIDRTELGNAINSWAAGTLDRTTLGQSIQSWAS